MRVLVKDTIYECQSVSKRTYEMHGKKKELCKELSISLVPVQPLNLNETIRVVAYTDKEKTNINLAFVSLLEKGYADLNIFEHIDKL